MGSGCGGRYQTVTAVASGNEDEFIDALKQPKQAPPEVKVTGAPPVSSPASSSSTSVVQLKQRLQELGWKLPAGSVEKSDLQRMVKDAEEQHALRQAAKASRTLQGAPPPTTPTVTTANTRSGTLKSGSSLNQTLPTTPATSSTSLPFRPGMTPERIGTASSPRTGRSVAELKKRLHDLGYVIPVYVQEKKDLVALVEKAEEKLQENKQSQQAKTPVSASSKTRSVAQLKGRLQELGVKVPQDIVEKRELVILVEEAERRFEQKSGAPSQESGRTPSSPSNLERRKTVTCQKTTLGVSKIQVSEEPFAPPSPGHVEVVRGREVTWTKGKLIGRGALGLVYRAEAAGDVIAVKEVMIDTRERQETKFKEDLENEIRIMQELKHENIVSYLGHDYVDDRLYIYLDYMPGGSISHVLREYGPFDENLLARYSKQLLKGLEYLHTQSPPVIHRDIKGGNVLIGRDDIVKWADFGCSKRMDSEKTQTMLRGSIPWMAPEVVAHSRYGWFSDVWSFGCLVIEMGTARQPWGNFENQVAALMKIGMSSETPPLPEGVSEDCQGFITQCCQRDFQKRPSTSELLQHSMLRNIPDQ